MVHGSNPSKILKDYLNNQSSLDTLRFFTCGSVDDGKSTLIGRILFEAGVIFDDQIKMLKNDSKRIGTQGSQVDFALLVDGLSSEREQGITIDVGYTFFSTKSRKFIIADTPGHEQYTRNMVTGASTSEVAIILIDATKGVLPQTRRHSIICSTLGIKKIILAVNKMDLVDYSEEVYNKIKKDYLCFSKKLKFEMIISIPLSALKGDNVILKSKNMKWYVGKTIFNFLENVDTRTSILKSHFRLPVQWVNRPNQNFRGFSGIVESGCIKVGEKVKILPSGETANINEILLYKDTLKKIEAGRAATVVLNREIDVSRGDVIVSCNSETSVADQFQTNMIWMNQEPGYVGRSYLLKIGTKVVGASITKINFKININSFEKLSANRLNINNLYSVKLKTDKPVPFSKYEDCKGLGGLILIERINNQTVAAGMIEYALHRSNNIKKQNLQINKKARQKLNGNKSKVLWLTGLSGSGKSTIANALEKELYAIGIRTYILDGDNVRLGLNKDLGFSDFDRIENIRRISEVAKLMVDAGIVVITAVISPFEVERNMAKSMFKKGEFIEIFVDAPIEVVESRDPKGLYKKARSGLIPNFTGIDSPYEVPEKPDIHIYTNTESLNYIIEKILKKVDF